MKCSNCPSSATYTVNDPGLSVVFSCRQCLPKHLYARAQAGQLDLPKPPTQTKKKSAAAEDVVVEPEVSDEDNEG
jgi:hypothetical protein